MSRKLDDMNNHVKKREAPFTKGLQYNARLFSSSGKPEIAQA